MTFLRVDSRSATPVYLQIVDQVRTGVMSRSLKPGDLLPSVRQLASDLGINPNTVAKAYMLLDRDGIIETARRRGSFIAKDANERITEQSDRHVDVVLDRMLDEAKRLGIDFESLRTAMNERAQHRGGPNGDATASSHGGGSA